MKIEISYKNSVISSLSEGESIALHLNGQKLTEDLIVRAVSDGETPKLSAPTISLNGDILTITDNSGLATSFDILVDGEVKYTYAKYLYNGVLLPSIPKLVDYPYCWIRKNITSGNYDLVYAAHRWYYKTGGAYCSVDGSTEQFYIVPISNADSAEGWTFNKTTTSYFTLDTNRTVLWSNHDIPNGSATATAIYFEGTEPIPSDAVLTSATFDLTALNLASGTHSITCIAKANGYKESEPSNAVEYRLTDLTGTTWKVPSGWSAAAGYGVYQLDGSFARTGASDFSTDKLYRICIGYNYYSTTNPILTENQIAVHYNKTSSSYGSTVCTNTYDLTLTITGGTDATNANLIAWLEANGELQ